jgi:beta-glucanase (GH16 family)
MIQYYIDDPTQPYFVVTASDLLAGDTWPFSSSANPFFLLMNVAVGGTLGNPTDTTTSNPPPMLVDYVRQYLPSAISPPQLTPNGTSPSRRVRPLEIQPRSTCSAPSAQGELHFPAAPMHRKGCVVTSSDAVNNHTVDFGVSGTATVTVTVATTTNAQFATVCL